MKKYISFVLKASLAAAILIWMERSGKLNWSQVAGALGHWPDLIIILLVIYLQVAMTAWRWELLLRVQGFSIGLRRAFQLNMIGGLFNTVIPGAVGGDVMKAYYITRGAITHKAEAVATVVLDRIIGMLGLLVLAGGVALWNLSSVKGNDMLMAMCGFAIAAACGSLVGFFLVVRFGSLLAIKNPSGRLAILHSRMLTGLGEYRKNRAILPGTILVSMLCHGSVCCAIYLAMRALNAPDVLLRHFLLAAPLGLLVTAIPVAPAGIGVGQMAFFSLFQMLAPASARDVVNAYTVFQTLALLVCLSGFIPYFFYRRNAV